MTRMGFGLLASNRPTGWLLFLCSMEFLVGTGEEVKCPIQNLSCDVKRELLRIHISALAKLKVVEQENAATLLAAGTIDGLAFQCAQRIKAVKALSSAARARYAEHCHAHRC